MTDDNNDIADLQSEIDKLREEVVSNAVRGSIPHEPHAELAAAVDQMQRTLQPFVDELPEAAAIEPVDDNGEPAAIEPLLDALEQLDKLAHGLGFTPEPPATKTS